MTLHLPPRPVRGLVACIALACLLTGARPARAADRATEAAAKQALAAAMRDHTAGDDDGAILQLQRARKACGTGRCSTVMRASILRDLGVFQFSRGDRAKASASFSDALDVEPDLPWNAAFDAADLVAEWAAVKAERAALKETPPQGELRSRTGERAGR